jgi:DNA-binding CsgD family transcriptional regulator
MRRVEHPWDEAEAHHLFGRALQSRGDAPAARKHFDAAVAILRRIGAAERFIGRINPAPRTGSTILPAGPALRIRRDEDVRVPAELSHREIEVLRLVVAGMTNVQIGIALHLARPTVATHIRHILEKTGTANRTEAAAYAVRNALT